MANIGLTVTLHGMDASFGQIARTTDNWPQAKRHRFARDWRTLEDAGAELAEFEMTPTGLMCSLSDDFLRHCRAHGIAI